MPFDIFVLFFPFRIRLCSFARSKRLLKVCDYVIDVLCSHRYPNEIFRDAAISLFLVAELFVRGGPRVDRQGLRVANTVICSVIDSHKGENSILGQI